MLLAIENENENENDNENRVFNFMTIMTIQNNSRL